MAVAGATGVTRSGELTGRVEVGRRHPAEVHGVRVVPSDREAKIGQWHVLLRLDAHGQVPVVEVVHMQARPADGLVQGRAAVGECREHLARAVVMRSAPGLPMASTPPSADAPDGRRHVGREALARPRRLPRLSSCSPRQLFSQMPVPGTVAPEP